jgi:hypothetical protein
MKAMTSIHIQSGQDERTLAPTHVTDSRHVRQGVASFTVIAVARRVYRVYRRSPFYTESIFNPLTFKRGPNGMSLFDGVKFFCTSTLSDKRKTDITLLLESNGAHAVPLGEATHIITLSIDYGGQDCAKEGSVTVTVRLSWARNYAYVLTVTGFLGRPNLDPGKTSAVCG